MSNVIDAEARFNLLAKLDTLSRKKDDQFLVNEGLELLASYRAIDHPGVRLAARNLLAQLALTCGKDQMVDHGQPFDFGKDI